MLKNIQKHIQKPRLILPEANTISKNSKTSLTLTYRNILSNENINKNIIKRHLM